MNNIFYVNVIASENRQSYPIGSVKKSLIDVDQGYARQQNLVPEKLAG